MRVFHSVVRLWRHRAFRRLMTLRVVTQASDGTVQVGLASYVLFSPYQQPDGWSIATVLAITLLPFSIVGPFVSVVLDRWSRRQIMLVTDVVRVLLALILGALIYTGDRSGPIQLTIAGVALVALSLNRFLLAALSSALPHTIDPDEYLSANTVMPLVGPAGVAIGGSVVLVGRLVLSQTMPVYRADAVAFGIAAVGFAVSAILASRFGRRELGPDGDLEKRRAKDVLTGLADAFKHLGQRPPAALGLATIGVQRVIFGIATVGTILIYRNYFHDLAEVGPAITDLAAWAGATTIGFLSASAVTPPMAARLGVRRWMVILAVAAAVFQVFPGSVFTKVTLVIAAFLLGLIAQSFKICTDTLVQAHIDDRYKGRVFVLYDMIFNAAQVLAAVIAAIILPTNGASVPVFLSLAVCYLGLGVVFWAISRRLGAATFDEGTQAAREPLEAS